ncbi:MAG: restriction endonuclease subunit M [Candidatus Anoxymicrobium japonicum]|uniref:site-specific DNA-methyltransferase (adenine-specific) n=1 Tax=Candidatus Anoxymicrobium japonicum TaxID=2013648 RepID=A0A2N3G5H8_9ACTN|nr:MAG: restriction endonuclease subunit M [Candidatus Anoxymicrobium japonicum]
MVPSEVLELTERFEMNREAYLSGQYKESQLRLEFIDPFFKALGWDVYNEQGYAEQYKDVIVEDAVKVGEATKAPDYCFRIGGTRKFFVEAKKPSVNLKDDISPAFQLRRYAWSAKLPLSLLTDFEELAVYDCRVKPVKTDKASRARTLYFTYPEYEKRWDEIASVFSREAVLKGSFDKYAESKKPKGTAEVDEAFLKEIESWRDLLARNIALRNSGMSHRELNYAVQRTIDRIIFLRICEARGIEIYGALMALLNGPHVYPRLFELFRKANDRYNSGLFHFREEKERPEYPDELTPGMVVDDKPLKEIIRKLYYPESPYEFSVLPADILGQVYEQFLGKVIRLTPRHRAVVEEKPEVKKAGGVYYTPTFIVDYIVDNTVGKLLEGKTPKQASKLKILDPACGSGSFLIGAFQHLLDWHRDRYVEDGLEKLAKGRSPKLFQGLGGDWRLTTGERKRILLNNIYGVDIDPQAVEVTKLSLLLKVLEGESDETLTSQLKLFHERALPDLGNNIKCGNSLIGPDYYDNKQMSLMDDEERYRINTFDWNGEFPEIVKAGGFDTVIGNPPYGIVFDIKVKSYLEFHYPTFIRNNDNYVAFSQRAVDLLKPNCLFGFIIPNTFLVGPYFNDFKRYVLERADVTQIVDFGINQVFRQPNVFTALLFLQKRLGRQTTVRVRHAELCEVSDIDIFPASMCRWDLDKDVLESLSWKYVNPLDSKLTTDKVKLDDISLVKDVGLNYWTRGRGKKRGGSIADRVLYEGKKQEKQDMQYLKGRDVKRYEITFGDHWLRHNYEELLDPRVDTFRFSSAILEQRKIVYRQTSDRMIASLELTGMLTDKTLHSIVLRSEWEGRVDLRYILGILNSKLTSYLYRTWAHEEGRTFAQAKIFRTKQIPIPGIEVEDDDYKVNHDRMVELVEEIFSLKMRLADAKTPTDKTSIQRQIDATDRQIDRMVYELYGLTEDEIKIVEQETG